jgi:AcrR family transcriptional regulator
MSQKSPRSAAKQRICDAALAHFVTHGYDGASLNQIAEMVGIRKPSIYAHFANKDALFLTVLEDAIAAENAFILSCFETEQALPGQMYCELLKQHYQDALHFRFLLRTAYVPPESLREQITQLYNAHLALCQQQITTALTEHNACLVNCEYLSEAYLGLVDSLHVELLYAGIARFDVRLNAMWTLFATALSQHLNNS